MEQRERRAKITVNNGQLRFANTTTRGANKLPGPTRTILDYWTNPSPWCIVNCFVDTKPWSVSSSSMFKTQANSSQLNPTDMQIQLSQLPWSIPIVQAYSSKVRSLSPHNNSPIPTINLCACQAVKIRLLYRARLKTNCHSLNISNISNILLYIMKWKSEIQTCATALDGLAFPSWCHNQIRSYFSLSPSIAFHPLQGVSGRKFSVCQHI